MARRRIIEGTWTCTSCGESGILGRHKVCPHCSSPREEGETTFDFGDTKRSGASTAATVQDAALLERAAAGADWHCPRCDAANRGDVDVCRSCGAARRGATPPAPAPRPEPQAVLTDRGGVRVIAPIALGVVALSFLACVGAVGVYAFVTRAVDVDAEVTGRSWVREITVDRLTPERVTGWQSEQPRNRAGVPGGGAPLAPGLGEVHGCDTLACWPRPPDGGTTGVVLDRRWSHTVTATPMKEVRREGWDDGVPRASASRPSMGSGGQAGVLGRPSCSRRERVPERCRTVKVTETCGTETTCTTRDLGNGFAEEVCHDVPKTCTVDKEECDPAEHDDWCTWTELVWADPISHTADGTWDPPTWPRWTPPPDSRVEKTPTYTLILEPRAGVPDREAPVLDLDAFTAVARGQLVYAIGGRVVPVPAAQVPPPGPRVDCGTGIPRDVLTTRDRCTWTAWSWVTEPPVTSRGDADGAWPAVDLRDDGVEKRREWIEVDLHWTRGKRVGTTTLERDVDQWGAWPPGATLPVRVDADAALIQLLEDPPGRAVTP